jgi:hypothetical protein
MNDCAGARNPMCGDRLFDALVGCSYYLPSGGLTKTIAADRRSPLRTKNVSVQQMPRGLVNASGSA